MPDPFTVLGGVAASAQLVDVAAKLSKELYGFFRSVRSVNADTRRQLEILDDLKDALALVSSFISNSLTARNTTSVGDGFTKLETGLRHLCDELRSTRLLIPPGPYISFAAKARWAMKRKEFDTRLKEVESRKASVLMTLELLSMQDQKLLLRKTCDLDAAIQNLQRDISYARVTETAILNSVSALSTETATYQSGTEQTLCDITHAIPREGKQVRDSIEAHGEQLSRLGDTLCQHNTDMGGWMSAQTQLLQGIATALPQETSKIGHRLDDLLRSASATSRSSRESSSMYQMVHRTEHLITRIAREEIRQGMAPVLGALAQSQMRNEQLVESLNKVLDDLSNRIWDSSVVREEIGGRIEDTCKAYLEGLPNSQSRPGDMQSSTDLSSHNPGSGFHIDLESKDNRLKYSHAHQPHQAAPVRHGRYRKIWSHWLRISWLGNINIAIKQRKSWKRHQISSTTGVFISVTFWPLWPLIRHRGLSLLYTTEPFYNGYYQIMPAIATFPIISRDAPIWLMIKRGDTASIRNEIENRRVHVNAQDTNGNTLLHWACYSVQLETCKMLLAMEADPNNFGCHSSPLESLLYVAWDIFAWECRDGLHLSSQAVLQLIQDFAQAGSDIEDFRWGPVNFNMYPRNDKDKSLRPSVKGSADLAEFSGFLRRSHQHLSDNLDKGLIKLLGQGSMHIATALECGLNPNYGKSMTDSPIFVLLYRAVPCPMADTQVDFHVENLAHLLAAGADQCRLFWMDERLRHRITWSAVLTPFVFAIAAGIVEVWESALKRVGLDPAEVWAEDERRRKEFLRLSGGVASSLDYGNSKRVSSLRLRERRVYEEE